MAKLSDCETKVDEDCSEDVRALLEKSRRDQDPDAPGALYALFNRRLKEYKESNLYPHWTASGAESEGVGFPRAIGPEEEERSKQEQPPSYLSAMAEFAAAGTQWYQLTLDLKTAAEHIWKDEFAQDTSDEESRKRLSGGDNLAARSRLRLESLISYSHAFLLQMVEAQLYERRMESNFGFFVIKGTPRAGHMRAGDSAPAAVEVEQGESSASAADEAQAIIRQRMTKIRNWNSALSSVTKEVQFVGQSSGAERLKSLSREFSSERVQPEELGWAGEADSASSAIRYQYFNALLAQQWRDRHIVRATWLTMLQVIIGYGLKPWRFLVTSGAIIGLFSVLYYVNDIVMGTRNAQYSVSFGTLPDALRTLGDHIGVSLATISSLGPNPRPTGPLDPALLIAESLIGYFLFAVLAALLVEQLTELEL